MKATTLDERLIASDIVRRAVKGDDTLTERATPLAVKLLRVAAKINCGGWPYGARCGAGGTGDHRRRIIIGFGFLLICFVFFFFPPASIKAGS